MKQGSPHCMRRVVIYGTSLSTERTLLFWRKTGGAWVGQLRAMLKSLQGEAVILNRSKWGADSRWGKRNFINRVVRAQPITLMLEFSINDADKRRQLPIKESRENLEWMIKTLQIESPDCEIILMIMNPAVGLAAQWRPNLSEYYDVYRHTARDWGVGLMDFYPSWRRVMEDPNLLQQCLPDGLHPSPEGCRTAIYPIVVEALGLISGKNGRPI